MLCVCVMYTSDSGRVDQNGGGYPQNTPHHTRTGGSSTPPPLRTHKQTNKLVRIMNVQSSFISEISKKNEENYSENLSESISGDDHV